MAWDPALVLKIRVRLQLAEITGPDNRWFCAQAYGAEIHDPDILARYFCEQGGAADFARRFKEAMGDDNRWFCSQYYGREITDPVILWRYYMNQLKNRSRSRLKAPAAEICLGC